MRHGFERKMRIELAGNETGETTRISTKHRDEPHYYTRKIDHELSFFRCNALYPLISFSWIVDQKLSHVPQNHTFARRRIDTFPIRRLLSCNNASLMDNRDQSIII
jgi:hypothetical protein